MKVIGESMRIKTVLVFLCAAALAASAVVQTKASGTSQGHSSFDSAHTVFIEADGVKYAYRRLGAMPKVRRSMKEVSTDGR